MALQKENLWQVYIRKNPHWITDNVTLTPGGLRKLFDQTFNMGHALGVENGKALAGSSSKPSQEKTNKIAEGWVEDLFGGIFDGRK